jgi:hypothetical protein
MISQEAKERIRWQNSPLRWAIDEVVRASVKHGGYRVGSNRATHRVVGAAAALSDIMTGIYEGTRDPLGYYIGEGK